MNAPLNATPFRPSAYQVRIFDWVEKGTGCAIVNAVAGSGKTTTIRESLPSIPERCSVQLLAFNASAAKDLQAAIAKLAQRLHEERGESPDRFRNVRAKTFHSLGYGAVLKKLNKTPQQVTVTGGKVRDLARQTLGDHEYEMYADFAVRLVALAKGQGVGPLVPDVDQAWYEMITHHDLYLDDERATEAEAVRIARTLLEKSNRQAVEAAVIDYDDQLYLPLLWRCRLWQNDWVVVDEAQDTNPVRRALAKLALRPGGRLMAYGDRRQAIYGFTGASADAMDLIAREFRCVELPLTVSYRCPKAVARRVREIVPYFEVPETAAEGRVCALSLEETIAALGPRDAILCRQTAPLVELAFKLIGRGVGCSVLGREIGQGLVNLIKKQKAAGVDRLLEKLAEFQTREVAKHMARGEEGKAEAVMDRVACIHTVVDNLPETERTVPALIRRLEDMFSDGASGVLSLATIHKVKGREYPRVAVLAPELSPSKWARQEWQYEQELNLIYVRDTRVLDWLITITDGPAPRRKPEQTNEPS